MHSIEANRRECYHLIEGSGYARLVGSGFEDTAGLVCQCAELIVYPRVLLVLLTSPKRHDGNIMIPGHLDNLRDQCLVIVIAAVAYYQHNGWAVPLLRLRCGL